MKLKATNNKVTNKLEGLKSGVVYTFSTVFSRGLTFLTVPIFTRVMTTEQIGIVNLYTSWYSLISVVATLALTSGGFAVAMKEFESERDEYQSSLLTLTSIIALFLLLIYIICPNFWNDITGLPTKLMILMFVGYLVSPARDFWLARERYEYKYKWPAIVTILSAFLASTASIIVVLQFNRLGIGDTAEGRIYAHYSVLYIFAFILWICIMSKGRTFINLKYWKFSLALSIPLVGYNVAAQILNVADRMMISKLISNSAVGIYSTLYTVSSISTLIWQAINSSFVPYLFKNIEKKENNIKDYSYFLLSIYACLAIVLTFLAPEIVRIIATNDYYEAIYIMPPIAAGVFFTSLAQTYSNVVVYYKKTKYVMYPAVIAAILNVFLNYIFIKKYGYMAAAYTTLVSYIVWAIVQMLISNRISIKYGNKKVFADKKIITLSIVTVGSCLSGLLLYQFILLRYAFVLALVLMINYFMRKRKK